MSGQYKIKKCPNCSKEHRKRGLFCGQSCANSMREPTENMREAMRQVANDYNLTPEAIANQKKLNTSLASMKAEDFAVDIPDVADLRDYDEFIQGYDRGENW
jgi:hypothetical protein